VKPSIFVVEDDPDISRLVRHHLENDGFAVRVYPNGSNVIADAERQRPALFVLDIMVPGKDGLELCRTVRQTPSLAPVPVIFLTAKSSEADRVLGLEIGADDYIAKPFSPRELVARVKAVLRRTREDTRLPDDRRTVVHGTLRIDPERHKVAIHEEDVPLTATEFRILHYLASRPGRVFTRDQILTAAMGPNSMVLERNIDVHIRSIRRKLGEHRELVETVRAIGYRFAEAEPAR